MKKEGFRFFNQFTVFYMKVKDMHTELWFSKKKMYFFEINERSTTLLLFICLDSVHIESTWAKTCKNQDNLKRMFISQNFSCIWDSLNISNHLL